MDPLTMTDPDGDQCGIRDLTDADKGIAAQDDGVKLCKATIFTKVTATRGEEEREEEHEIWLTLDNVSELRDWCNAKLAAEGYARTQVG